MLTVIEEAAKRVGGVPELARRIGVTRQAIDQWVEVPLERVADLAGATGLAKASFRPDVFEAETAAGLYERDFNAWAERQAALFEAGSYEALDRDNLLEEIRDLSASLKRALGSHVKIVLIHLLKWAHQPSRRSSSWRGSISEGRDSAEDLMEESPSLRTYPAEILATAYIRAVRTAARETGLQPRAFPAACPFTVEQVLDHGFFPDQPLPEAAP